MCVITGKRFLEKLDCDDNKGIVYGQKPGTTILPTIKPLHTILSSFKEFEMAQAYIEEILRQLLSQLDVSAVEGINYERVYGDISKFSMLIDIEGTIDTLCNIKGVARTFRKDSKIDLNELNLLFRARFELTKGSYQNDIGFLTSRFNILQLFLESLPSGESGQEITTVVRNEVSEIWLERSKICRKSQQFPSAFACLLNVKEMHYVESIIERAKIFWKQVIIFILSVFN